MTLAQWVEDVRYHLDGDNTGEGNQLASGYTAGSGSMVFTYELGNIAPGAILSCGTNVLRVMAVNTSTKTATVIGGWNGSTDATAASGSLVRVNPRFTDHRIVKALNDHLSSLSSPEVGLCAVADITLAYVSTADGYDLTTATGLERLLEVRRTESGSAKKWVRLRAGEYELHRQAATADFASGKSLRLIGGRFSGCSGVNVQVVYGKAFTALAALTDDVTGTGLSSTALDIPPLGAAYRLMTGREAARNSPRGAQGNARRADEVPAGAVGRSYGDIVGLWQTRVREEVARLRAQFPMMGA